MKSKVKLLGTLAISAISVLSYVQISHSEKLDDLLKIAFVAAFAAIAGYGVYANQKSEVLSDLTLANVEALAGSGETTIECCLALWGTCKGDIKAPYVCASR